MPSPIKKMMLVLSDSAAELHWLAKQTETAIASFCNLRTVHLIFIVVIFLYCYGFCECCALFEGARIAMEKYNQFVTWIKQLFVPLKISLHCALTIVTLSL
jgi:hypothetical protein